MINKNLFINTFLKRIGFKSLFIFVMFLCFFFNLFKINQAASNPLTIHSNMDWAYMQDGVVMRPLALSAVEARFAHNFPGTIARMTDGNSVYVLRHVNQPTRMLHPAADCYRGLGYLIEAQRLEEDNKKRLWRCFTARSKQSPDLRVCERIVDAQGLAFTDTSVWYWTAVSGQSLGPWQSITTARAL